MDGLEHFLSLIEKNLDNKSYSEETKKKILDKIRKKYEDSEIFKSTQEEEQLTLEYDYSLPVNNCFGITNEGFRSLDYTSRPHRVNCLRNCYAASISPFPPEETVKFVDEKGRFGRTPLHEAVDDGDYVQVAYLLKNGANPYMSDNNGHTPHMLARLKNNQAMIAFLSLWGIKE